MTKIDYNALISARNQIVDCCLLNLGSDLILPELPESIMETDGDNSDTGTNLDEELLKKLHMVLLDIHIVEGHLICPDTGRRFKVSNGIPNMILHEDEI